MSAAPSSWGGSPESSAGILGSLAALAPEEDVMVAAFLVFIGRVPALVAAYLAFFVVAHLLFLGRAAGPTRGSPRIP